jgi:hypothetical protein
VGYFGFKLAEHQREGRPQFQVFKSSLCFEVLTPSPSVLGEGWGGGLEAVLNLCEKRLRFHQSLAIRKPQHAKAVLGEPVRACFVPGALTFVLPSIQLDHHHAFDATEVDDVRTDRMLAAKLHTQLMPPQMHPEPAFGVGLVAAQSPCLVAREKRRTHGRKIRTKKRRKTRYPALPRSTPTPTLPPKLGDYAGLD